MPSPKNTSIPNTTLVRRANLLVLLHEFTEQHLDAGESAKGVEQAFAAHLQMLPSRFSQIKSSRPIGDKLARQIEALCKRPALWLDAEHIDVKPSAAEESFIALARSVWRKQNAKQKRMLMLAVKNFNA